MSSFPFLTLESLVPSLPQISSWVSEAQAVAGTGPRVPRWHRATPPAALSAQAPPMRAGDAGQQNPRSPEAVPCLCNSGTRTCPACPPPASHSLVPKSSTAQAARTAATPPQIPLTGSVSPDLASGKRALSSGSSWGSVSAELSDPSGPRRLPLCSLSGRRQPPYLDGLYLVA